MIALRSVLPAAGGSLRGDSRDHYDRTSRQVRQVLYSLRPFIGWRGLWETNMKPRDLKLMSVDELWALHLEIQSLLPNKIAAEKTKYEQLLQQLKSHGASSRTFGRERRPYPKVLPKYRNPAKPAETWSGRGSRPRWLTAELKTGKKLADFRIAPSSGRARRAARR